MTLQWTAPLLSALMMADWAMSEWAVRTGIAVEANPLPWAHPDWMAVVKIAALVITLGLLWMMKRHWPRLAQATALGACVAMSLVVINNAGVILQ